VPHRSYVFACTVLLASLATSAVIRDANAADIAPNLTGPVGQPAAWRLHDLVIDLHDLPTRYSCDDLWYKFHDILLTIGARPDTNILVYSCSGQMGANALSPSVHLRFATPELLSGAQTRWADMHAAPETIRLTPGQPASLRPSDCALMRQIKDELLSELGDRIVSYKLACSAPRSIRWPFAVTVQALAPVYSSPRVVAHADSVSPLSPRAIN